MLTQIACIDYVVNRKMLYYVPTDSETGRPANWLKSHYPAPKMEPFWPVF